MYVEKHICQTARRLFANIDFVVMAKHKAADGPKETIQEFRIHWDTKTRDGKIWPEYTVVTDGNFPAILELLKANPVMGVLEIKLGSSE
jgi:hypothetical protein